MEIFTVENLTFTYPGCREPAINGLSLTVGEGSFCVLCGPTGCGKTTLLRMLKKELIPQGTKTGRILYNGQDAESLGEKISAFEIGYVCQEPEQQIVTDKVWHELVFGAENAGMSKDAISRRLAELSNYFGLEELLDKNTADLSGGEKQLLSLAAAMITDPKVLLLDEPTAQLDPVAASSFIATLKKLQEDLGVTVVIAEHRLEELIPLCDKLIILQDGRLVAADEARPAISSLSADDRFIGYMPLPVRLYFAAGAGGSCPLTLREGRDYILDRFSICASEPVHEEPARAGSPALSVKDLFFRYDKDGKDVLDGLSFEVYENEIFCILGGNGSGKTTALKCVAGLCRPYAGSIRVFGKKLKEYKDRSLYRACLAMLPQDVQTLFLRNTVKEELTDAGVELSALPFDLTPFLDKHPYDLSGGEQQLLGLAKVLASRPKLLLLDEPTKGLDAEKKEALRALLKELAGSGVTVVLVSHDVEFAAKTADRTALFFGGRCVCVGKPEAFFAENRFYTTAAGRLTRGLPVRASTLDALLSQLRPRAERSEEC